MVSGQAANFTHQLNSAHFLGTQGGSNVIQIRFFSGNQFTVNLSRWLNQKISITLLARATAAVLLLGMQTSKAWCEVHDKPMQDGKVGHVDAVYVARDCGRLDVGRVVASEIFVD